MQAEQKEKFLHSFSKIWNRGDYVMVHAGVAIAKITEEDDDETDQLMEDML